MKLKRIDLNRGVQLTEGATRREVVDASDELSLEFDPEEEVVEVSRNGKLVLLIPRDNVVSMTPA